MKNMLENYKLTIMKELSVEEKAKCYDEAIKRASNLHKDAVEMENNMTTKTCEIIFPELEESDENVREDIISLVNEFWDRIGSINLEYTSRGRMIAWLEKQHDYNRLIEEMKKRKELLSKEKEKATSANDKLSLGGRIAMLQELLAFNICNTTYKEEPKFHKGDWVVRGGTIAQILDVQEQYYVGLNINGKDFTSSRFLNDDKIHLWTIKDAKDGDVLASKDGDNILIFRNLDTNTSFSSYYNIAGKGELGWSNSSFIPATNEQQDLLFQKMREAGYVWDAEKKELKKIEVTSKESEDEGIKTAILNHLKKMWGNCQDDVCGVNVEDAIDYLEKQGEQKQTWEPSAAQLIVIKALIEDKNTSKVNKVILRGMLDEFKQYFKL